jgi:2-oxoisovalerate dehydrogenase E2 component (dihydrolipoyl transacylase)
MARFPFVIPFYGRALDAMTIQRWHVAVGDWVEENAPLVDLENDKAEIEEHARVAGRVIELLHPVGTTLLAGEAAAIFESEP